LKEEGDEGVISKCEGRLITMKGFGEVNWMANVVGAGKYSGLQEIVVGVLRSIGGGREVWKGYTKR
jgi:hypothetical protein